MRASYIASTVANLFVHIVSAEYLVDYITVSVIVLSCIGCIEFPYPSEEHRARCCVYR